MRSNIAERSERHKSGGEQQVRRLERAGADRRASVQGVWLPLANRSLIASVVVSHVSPRAFMWARYWRTYLTRSGCPEMNEWMPMAIDRPCTAPSSQS